MSRPGRVLHTGALTAFARGSIYMAALLRLAVDADMTLAVPTGALAQAWAQTPASDRYRLDYLMHAAAPVPLDDQTAREVGDLLAGSGSADTVAGHAVQHAVAGNWAVLTDNAGPLRALHLDVEVDEVP